MWTATWEFRCWYVQLQSRIVRTPHAIETMDHALDVVIDPDGQWHWKDEDDFAEAQRLGAFTPEEAAAVRREGERVIAERLWITGWDHWRP
jgi:predicted RNA-binding protein associated with RNAse of E/G family